MSRFAMKYAADKILALMFLVLLSPVLVLIVVLMIIEGVLDPKTRGPFLYRETRISQNKPFNLLKFRTLKMSVIEKLTYKDSATFFQTDSSNMTRTGRLLIRVYFDELPQLFCILMGKMTFVGPRPRIDFVYQEDLEKGHSALKYLRGGLTGPHQLSKGTSRLSTERSEEYLRHIEKLGPWQLLWFDIRILAKTVLMVFKAEGL